MNLINNRRDGLISKSLDAPKIKIIDSSDSDNALTLFENDDVLNFCQDY